MQISVKNPSGNTFALDVDSNDTTEDVWAQIQDQEGYPNEARKCVSIASMGKMLDADHKLSDYNIENGSTISYDFQLPGGMAPKKKKGKKGKKGKKKSSGDDDEEKKDENAEFRVELPKFGWIKIKVSSIDTVFYT